MTSILSRETQVRALVGRELDQRNIPVSVLPERTEAQLTALAMEILLSILSVYNAKIEKDEEQDPTDPYADLSHYEVLAVLQAISATASPQTAG